MATAESSHALAYLKGHFVPQSQAALPLHDAGFVMGATVTDLCRTFRHRLFRWQDHLARFRQSCRAAAIPLQETDAQLTQLAEELVAHNSKPMDVAQDLALVIFATPGPIGYYLGESGGPGDGPPTMGMHTFPLPFSRYHRLFLKGAHLVIPSVRHVPAESVDPRIKQRSRMHWWLAEQEAKRLAAHSSALLLDGSECVTETSAANFLLVKDGVVHSPRRTRILGGISLSVVEELCRQLTIEFAEADLSPADCQNGDEAMLCSTPYCLAGVSRINDSDIPWQGPIYQQILRAWNKLAGLDIPGQILSHL